MMYKKIVLSAFAKAQTETPGNTKTQWAGHLTDCLWNEYRYQVSRRTLLNYYNYYSATESLQEDLSPKARTIEYLCNYLCYPNYTAFIMHQGGVINSTEVKSQKMTYTLDGDGFKEQVTILIHREYTEALNVA